MTTEAQALAYCRAGLDTESIIAVLSAITAKMRITDPACVALDVCIGKLEAIQADAEQSALWAADDAACKRGNGAGSLPAFIREEATA